MSKGDTDPSESDASAVDSRTRRARTEDMAVALRKAGGIYTVEGESGNQYRVDISRGECTCPDQQKSSVDRCKHIRRVELELRNRTIPTPDGRLPDRPMADGGAGTVETDTEIDGVDSGRRIEGPIQEFDKYGESTGAEYYRCSVCGTESMRERNLTKCCPVACR